MKELKGYKKGVNFGGWLSQCDHKKDTYDNFIKAEDFAKAKEMGFDHIRVPVDYDLFEKGKGDFIEENFAYIDFAIENCRKNGLNMILDLHRTPGYSFDPGHDEKGLFESEEYQERFYIIWEELTRRFGMHDDMLVFELLNEVTKKEYQSTWNAMIHHTIEMIRKTSPKIKIIVGGYYNNSVEAIVDLDDPYDENVIYSFHFYEPLLFTHQGAYWIATMDQSFRCDFEMTYGEYEELSAKLLCQAYTDFKKYDPDKVIGEEFFVNLLEEAIQVADERDVCLYCGEFGVIDLADKKEAQKWFDIFYSVMEKYEIGSAIWSYRGMDFGIVD